MKKFNNGNGAIICDECSVIIIVGLDESNVPFTIVDNVNDETNHFCSEVCKNNYFKKKEQNG